ncbi:CaiB/BaiF CoA-transferase family protein [Lacisediminimonas sp.]|uniref:CaiB/BaiF CoA transferase family protein n=1 Tax=Lacisediminimonas sp. TaxID=3060582 RepID=UPI00271959A2|nr:CoA transferase [Lacisediminimonas sp.]MDO8301309.1 CoA transferase [Lacisediminimonas sp.]
MLKNLPLDGVRVIEICNVAAGPYCGMLLADMGADVIKVEHPDGGDTLRSWPPISEGFSENFASLNRNKRSVTLNLKVADDIVMLKKLIADADVLLENNRPGVMDRLGIGYTQCAAINPKLVYCSISAYGQTGPRSQEGGFDLTIQAMSGIMSVTGEAGGEPVKCGVPLADFSSGLYGAFAIVSALRTAEATGSGDHLDIPMLGATLGIAALQTSEYFGSGRDPVALGSAHPRNAPYRVFRSQDGRFSLAAGNNALWKATCEVVGRLDLLQDERFQTPTTRAKFQADLLPILEQEFARATSAQWLALFEAAGVPSAPINSYSEVLQDQQVRHMEWVQPLELPNGVKTRTFISPIRISGENLPVTKAPPALGQHNDEILGKYRRAP